MNVPIRADELKSKEYQTWGRMLARCHNGNHPKYHRYGGRGITVCKEWRESYRAFLNDIGRAPGPKYSIERLDNDGGYSRGNCVWATMKQQAQNRHGNRKIAYKGQNLTIAAWAERMNMDRRVLWKRLEAGWDDAKALTTPKEPRTKRAA